QGGGDQGGGATVAGRERVQTPADTVVIERGELLGCQSQRRRIAAGGPLGYAVEGFAGEQQVLQEDHQPLRRGDPRPPIFRGQIVTQNRFQPQPREQAIEDGQQAEVVGGEGRGSGLGRGGRGRRDC